MDASGKDGTVKHCLGGLNPMSVRVAGFKAPTSTELAHDFLWRVHQVVPQRGEIGIFNRSHYEDVLVVRVEELVPEAGLEEALRCHQRVRAAPRQRGHDGRQASSTSPGRSRRSASASASPIPRRTGSSRPTISPSGPSGMSTCAPTARCSSAPRRRPRPGTSSRRPQVGARRRRHRGRHADARGTRPRVARAPARAALADDRVTAAETQGWVHRPPAGLAIVAA